MNIINKLFLNKKLQIVNTITKQHLEIPEKIK